MNIKFLMLCILSTSWCAISFSAHRKQHHKKIACKRITPATNGWTLLPDKTLFKWGVSAVPQGASIIDINYNAFGPKFKGTPQNAQISPYSETLFENMPFFDGFDLYPGSFRVRTALNFISEPKPFNYLLMGKAA